MASSTNLVGALSLFENRNLVKPVVDSLLKNEALLNDCSRFVDALQLPIVYSTSIKKLLANPNAGSYYETVQQAMAHWVGSNGADASVSNLSAILLGSEFVSAAQLLESDMAQFANPKQVVEQQPFGIVPIMELEGTDFYINPQPLVDLLQEYGTRHFMIISIVGAMREGKSFIMSCIAAFLTTLSLQTTATRDWLEDLRENGNGYFKWEAGQNISVTKGVNIWKRPIILRKPDGSEFGVILLDAQGAFNYASSQGQSGLIFAFTSILASTSIFNAKYPLNSSVFDALQLFVDTAGQLFPVGNGDAPFQRFILLERDVPQIAGAPGYYTENLTPPSSNRNIFLDAFQYRGCLTNLIATFKTVGLYALPEPGENLKNDSLQEMPIRFRNGVSDFVKFLVSDHLPSVKLFEGRPIKASEYIPKFLDFVANIREVGTPTLDGLFISHLRCRITSQINILMETFNRDMSSELGNSEEGVTTVVIQTAFQAIKDSVLGKFEEFQLVDQGMRIEYREKLSNSIQQVYEQYCRTNQQKRRTHLAHMSLSNGLLTKTKELLLAARNELVAIDYSIYIVRSIIKVGGAANGISGFFGGRGTRDMDEAVFNVAGYQGALEALKSKVAQFEREYIDSTVDFDRVVRPAGPFETLKNELDIIRTEFVTFDWTNYSINQTFLRHENTKIFGQYIPALWGACTVFDTAKYANDIKAAADKLDQCHSRYFEAVVSSVRLDLE